MSTRLSLTFYRASCLFALHSTCSLSSLTDRAKPCTFSLSVYLICVASAGERQQRSTSGEKIRKSAFSEFPLPLRRRRPRRCVADVVEPIGDGSAQSIGNFRAERTCLLLSLSGVVVCG